MQEAKVFSASEDQGGEVCEWLIERLRAAGTSKVEAERVAKKLRADWAEMVHLLYPRKCQDQMIMVSITGEGKRVELALEAETCGGFDPRMARKAAAAGFGRMVRGELEGLARLSLPMEVKAPA